MSQIELRVFGSPEKLYQVAADRVARLAQDAVVARGRFLFVISGGGTPRPLFERLARPPYRDDLPWPQTHVFWADERMVPPGDEASNFGQAWSALLSHVAIPEEQLHHINGNFEPARAAVAYAKNLKRLAGETGWPHFDLVLLGLGADGHTASLFPGQTHLYPENVPAMAVQAQYDGRPAERVTLTPAAINSARAIIFLVTGREKAQALAQVLEYKAGSEGLPAGQIRPLDGSLTWLVDQEAAAHLDDQTLRSYRQPANNRKGDPHDKAE